MVKLQKLDYNVPGLFGAAALASALDMIPYFGHPLSVGALLFCMHKVTRSDYVDVLFTVFVGYALMFGMNLFLLGTLMGDLRPSARPDEATETKIEEAKEIDAAKEIENVKKMEKIREIEKAKKGAPEDAITPTKAKEQAPAAPAPPTKTKEEPVKKQITSVASKFSLKGLTRNANDSVAMVHTGVKTYTIGMGETISMDTPNGKVSVKLEQVVNDSSVVLNIGGERTVLTR
jgi:Tfp pilus assembly protein PilP